MPLSTRSLALYAASTLLALLLVANALIVARGISELGRSFANAERPAEVASTLDRLLLEVRQAESAQRGYLLTDEATYLEPYAGAWVSADSLLATLDTLVSWNPVQVGRMPGLRAAIGVKRDELEETIAAAGSGDLREAIDLVETDRGLRAMDEIRDRVQAMVTEARRVRADRRERMLTARRQVVVGVGVLNGAIVLALAGIAALVRRQARRRERDAAELRTALREREAALTHVHAMQSQLVHQEKLAGLGRLTAGVAHELKNPLNFINNFAQLSDELAGEVQEALAAGDPAQAAAGLSDLRQNVAKVAEHGERADLIVRSMLTHAQGVSGDRQPVDLHAVLDGVLEVAAGPGEAARPVRIVREDGPDLTGAPVDGVATALGRLFLNLVENAVHAVRERAGHDALGYDPTVWVRTRRDRDRAGRPVAVVVVEDNGSGVTDAALPRIFEPFYTTKSPGQGTGLGLSLAHDIAVGHGGSIVARRSPRGGASFTVTLPLLDRPGAGSA